MRGRPEHTPAEAAVLLGVLAALGVLACLSIGQAGTATAVYVAVTAVMWLSGRLALAVVSVLAKTGEQVAAEGPAHGRVLNLTSRKQQRPCGATAP